MATLEEAFRPLNFRKLYASRFLDSHILREYRVTGWTKVDLLGISFNILEVEYSPSEKNLYGDPRRTTLFFFRHKNDVLVPPPAYKNS